jgi:hypothetical protein
MTRYHYKINESDPQRITVRIYQGETQAATLTIIRENAADTPNFESVAVAVAFRQYGLSYALLHLALLYCKDKHETDCTVNNAHGTLIIALSQVGFVVLRQWRDPIAKQNQAMLTCDNLAAALRLTKKKLGDKGLIEAGLRNSGPYQFR